MNQALLSKVKRLVAKQFNIEADVVTAEANFRDTLMADSLDLIELTMIVAQYLELPEVVDEEMMQIKTVGQLVSYLEGNYSETRVEVSA